MWKKTFAYIKYYLFKTYSIKKCNDTPKQINNYVIYLINDWSIALKCPCGCNENIYLNTLKEASPKWSYSIKKRKINIFPSVDRLRGCKSHFWVKKGKIKWSQ